MESNTNEHISVRRLRNDFECVMFFREQGGGWGYYSADFAYKILTSYFYKLHLKYLLCGSKPEKT